MAIPNKPTGELLAKRDPEVEERDVDILIVGGGMAACGAAFEVKKWAADKKILLVDKAIPKQDRLSGKQDGGQPRIGWFQESQAEDVKETQREHKNKEVHQMPTVGSCPPWNYALDPLTPRGEGHKVDRAMIGDEFHIEVSV